MKRIVAAIFCAALAASAAAQAVNETPTQYSQLRQDHDDINDAIAAATESDLNGTFNRLSALYHRSPIESLLADAGTNDQLPQNFQRNLEATLIDLQEDLGKDQLDGLSPLQKTTILDLVSIYAVQRPLELWESNAPTTCPGIISPTCPTWDLECVPGTGCVDDDPAVINEVQDTVAASRTLYTAAYDSLTAAQQVGKTPPSQLIASTFIDDIRAISLTIKGVESIDD